jgi:hypothetical protein
LFSLYCLEIPDVRVVAVEPLPQIAAVLNQTLQAHITQGRARILVCGVGERDEDTSSFAFYPSAPGESTRFQAERTSQRDILRAAVEKSVAGDVAGDVMAGPERAALLDFLQSSAEVDQDSDIVDCPVMTLSAVVTRCCLPHIDFLKVLSFLSWLSWTFKDAGTYRLTAKATN